MKYTVSLKENRVFRRLYAKGRSPVIVQDFPLRGKKVFLNIRRRRWLLKKHNEYISRNWRMVAEGTRMTQDFASFLKELY